MALVASSSGTGFQFTVPVNVLDDLCCRFIINVPAQEKKDMVRICFQIEQAHWFYLDFYTNSGKFNLKPCGIKEFARNIFNHIPYLKPFVPDLDEIIEDWKEYKYAVPTFGAILLDEDLKYVLLVKSYWTKSSWGFPKGKINKDETPCNCAVREVFEETGFNIDSYIDENAYIEANLNDQCVRLYIIQGISKKYPFQPQTRNEIKEINWFLINDIPLSKSKYKNKLYSSFFMVVPFMRELRKWLLRKSVKGKSKNRRSTKSFSQVEHLLNFDTPDWEDVAPETDCKFAASYGKKKKKKESKQLTHQVNIHDDHYEGSDEDETPRSNEEVYGIPKVKPLGFHPKETVSVSSLHEIVDNFSFVREKKCKISIEDFKSVSYTSSPSPLGCLPSGSNFTKNIVSQINYSCDNNLVFNRNETRHCFRMKNDTISILNRNVGKSLNVFTDELVKSFENRLLLNSTGLESVGTDSKPFVSSLVSKIDPSQSLKVSPLVECWTKQTHAAAFEDDFLEKLSTCPQLSCWRNFKFDMKLLNNCVEN